MAEELSSLETLAPEEVLFLASPITVIIIVSKATQPITIPAIAPLFNHRELLPHQMNHHCGLVHSLLH